MQKNVYESGLIYYFKAYLNNLRTFKGLLFPNLNSKQSIHVLKSLHVRAN